MNLSADIYIDVLVDKWSANIREHPIGGGPGRIIWEKHNMSSEYNATTAMEAEWQKLQIQPLGSAT